MELYQLPWLPCTATIHPGNLFFQFFLAGEDHEEPNSCLTLSWGLKTSPLAAGIASLGG